MTTPQTGPDAERREPRPRRRRSSPKKLSRGAIVDAALHLAQDRGIAHVTMREVAQVTETGAASLYAYVDGRDDLIVHVLDAVYAQIPLAPLHGSWRIALGQTINDAVDTFATCPGLGREAIGLIPGLGGALRFIEHVLMLLDAGGITDETSGLAIDLILQHVCITAAELDIRHEHLGVREPAALSDRLYQTAYDAYAAVDPSIYPFIRARADQLAQPDQAARRAFAVSILLTGIESLSAHGGSGR